MENATKALLIAAGVLVVMLIIGFGVGIFQTASEYGDVDLDAQEIQQFNQPFTSYHGTAKRGTEVNAMLRTVLNSNLKNATEGNSNMLINVGGVITLTTGDKALPTPMADTSKLYKIIVKQDGPGGLVNTITVEEQP